MKEYGIGGNTHNDSLEICPLSGKKCRARVCPWFCYHEQDPDIDYIYYGECAVKEIAMRLKAGADNGEKI